MERRRDTGADGGGWRPWVLATAIGWPVGLIAGWIVFLLVVFALQLDQIGAMTLPFLPLGVAGAAVATAQSRVLRGELVQVRAWVVAGAAGWPAGALLAAIVGRSVAMLGDAALRSRAGDGWYLHQDDSLGLSFGLWAGGAALGLVVGAAQWLVLRRRANGAAGVVPASALAMAINLVIYDLCVRGAGFLGLLAFAVVGGLILGALTARPLARVVSKHPPA